jgi:hypothetical protein
MQSVTNKSERASVRAMFCPECKAEYRPGFVRCKDCDVELVDFLPSEPDITESTDDSPYVAVANVRGSFEEGQISSFLQAHGIPVQVQGAELRRLYGVYDGAGDRGLEILVPRDQAITALDLLAKANRGELEIEESDD